MASQSYSPCDLACKKEENVWNWGIGFIIGQGYGQSGSKHALNLEMLTLNQQKDIVES